MSLYGSGFADKRALSFVNVYMYGGGFDLLAALAAKASPFGLFATRRLRRRAIGLVGLFVTWRLGRRVGGPVAGLNRAHPAGSLPALLRAYVHQLQGRTFATVMAIALLGSRARRSTNIASDSCNDRLCGGQSGLAIGSRILGGFAVRERAAGADLYCLSWRSRESAFKLRSPNAVRF